MRVFLIGAEANAPEVDFGWIEAGPPLTSRVRANAPLETARAVIRFWEKPSMEDARELLTRGCLWNTFIFIGHRAAFGRMLARTQPTFWAQFEGLNRPEAPAQEAALAEAIYARIEPIDLSADVLQQAPEERHAATGGHAFQPCPQRVVRGRAREEAACQRSVVETGAAHDDRQASPGRCAAWNLRIPNMGGSGGRN